MADHARRTRVIRLERFISAICWKPVPPTARIAHPALLFIWCIMTPPELALDIKGVPCLQNQYWKRPTPPKPQGDPKVDPVYAAVGRALSQWEKLEQRLATLFIVVTRASDSSNNAVRRAYGAIENGTLRRKAIIAAAEVHFGASWQPHVEEAYNKLIDAVSRASKLRDDIAHGIVQHFKFNNIGRLSGKSSGRARLRSRTSAQFNRGRSSGNGRRFLRNCWRRTRPSRPASS